MWLNIVTGEIYQGDCVRGDRAATATEMAAWKATLDRTRLDAMTVSAFQAQAAMSLSQSRGVTSFDLLARVQQVVASSPDPLVAIAWNKAAEFGRQSPTILSLAAQVPLTSGQLDQLFQLAATISA